MAKLPTGFPDLSRFAQVDINQFVQTQQRNFKGVFFRPPSQKFFCSFAYKIEPASSSGVSCSGAIPGVPPTSSAGNSICVRTSLSVTGVSTGDIQSQGVDCRDMVTLGSVLPVGSKIVYGSVTCVEGEDDLTACAIKDVGVAGAGHGFVISQRKTWTF